MSFNIGDMIDKKGDFKKETIGLLTAQDLSIRKRAIRKYAENEYISVACRLCSEGN